MSSLLHPGPPPSTPPPPIPVSSSSRPSFDSFRVSTRTSIVKQSRDIPRPRPQRFRGPQWPARPQSQEITDAVVWPVKAPRKAPPTRPPPATPAPASAAPAALPSARRSTVSRPSADERRPSLSSLSLNRFSLHRSRTKQHDIPPLPKHARRPSSSSVASVPANVVDAKNDIANTTPLRTVQRQQSGLQPRANIDSPNPGDTVAPPHAPPTPTLQKKRSFFRRVADRLTRSRTSLRDDYRSRRSSAQSDAVIHEVPPVPRRSATLPNKALTTDSPPESPLPPTPTSNHKRSRRPPSIKLYASEEANDSRPDLPSPSAIPLPPSPWLESMTPSPSPHPSLRQPHSPAPSIKQPLSPILSLRIPPSPTASTHQPTSPAASMTWQPPSPGKARHPISAPPQQHSIPTSPRQSNYAESTGHATPASPQRPSSPAPVAVRQPVQSPSALYFPLPPQSPPPVKRHDTRGIQRDGRDDDRERERDGSRDASARPRGHYLPGTAEGNEEDEEDDEEEAERKASEMKVNRWLATPESPTTSSSLDHSLTLSYSHSQSSHSQSGGMPMTGATTKRFEGGSAFGGIDEEDAEVGLEMWRGAMMKENDGEDVLPEVERMALEAEERAHAMGRGMKKGDAKSQGQGKMGRQLSLFGRRRGRDDNVKAPTLRPRAATFADSVSDSKRRSFGFFSSHAPISPTALPLPPSPAFPISPTASEGLPVPAARPRPRRLGVSPTMHTRGSILLETNDIADPEVRRLSEMVFLT